MISQRMDRAIGSDDWITEEDVKDPAPLPDVPGHFVLVRPVTLRPKTKGGLILPDKFQEDAKYLTTVGKVLKVGATAYLDGDRFPTGAWCDEGDYVVYGRNDGTRFLYKGVRVILIYDDQVKMVIDDPKDIDPTFNLSN